MSFPIISPVGPLVHKGKEIRHFTSDIDVIWSTNGGTLSGISARAVDLTMDNKSQSIYLRGTNGSDHTDVLITVVGVIPNYWQFQSNFKAGKTILVFQADDGSVQSDIKRGAKRSAQLGSPDIDYTKFWDELYPFWDYHYSGPGRDCYLYDPIKEEYILVRINSDVDWKYNPDNGLSWGFAVEEV